MRQVFGEPVTSGNAAVSPVSAPGGHSACEAEIARLRSGLEVVGKHLPAVLDGLAVAVADQAVAESRRVPFTAAGVALQALRDAGVIPGPQECQGPEVRYVHSGDAVMSGDEIP